MRNVRPLATTSCPQAHHCVLAYAEPTSQIGQDSIISLRAADGSDSFIGEDSVRTLLPALPRTGSVANLIGAILGGRFPSKIGSAVVRGVAVGVGGLMGAARRRAIERRANQAMQQAGDLLAFVSKPDLQISTYAARGRPHDMTGLEIVSSDKALHAPVIANRIFRRLTNLFPPLCHNLSNRRKPPQKQAGGWR